MRKAILIFIAFLSFNNTQAQVTFKKSIDVISSGDRSQSYDKLEFIDNGYLVSRFKIYGRGVGTEYMRVFTDTGKLLGPIKHPTDTNVVSSVYEFEYGPWLSKSDFIVSHYYSNGGGSGYRYFFSVKYDTNFTAIWKCDSLLIYNHSYEESIGDIIYGTSDYTNIGLHRIDNSGNKVWQIDLTKQIVLNKWNHNTGVFTYNAISYWFGSNKKDSLQVISIDSNGTLLQNKFILGRNIQDIKCFNKELFVIQYDSTLKIIQTDTSLTTRFSHYSFSNEYDLNYVEFKKIKSGYLVQVQNKVDKNKFSLSLIPELRMLDNNLNYKLRKYFRINVFDHYQYNRDNYFIHIPTFTQFEENSYRIFFGVGSQDLHYRADKEYFILNTDSNLNVNDSIQLNGQIYLYAFDSVLTSPTQKLPWYSIEEYDGKPVVIFPNPASNQINIQSEEKFKMATIFNMTGKLIKEENLNENQTLDVTQIPKGQYILELVSAKGVIRKKVLVE
ncbi:MAG: T9SS type A sorting domain-containing protein [Salibacteraceae bacterium]